MGTHFKMDSQHQHQTNQDFRLDNLALETLNLMEQIVKYKLQLQDLMKAGTINLAKSRYIMGNRSVSVTQLPTEDSMPFDAICKVEHSCEDYDGVKTTVFSLKREEPAKKRQVNDQEDDIGVSISSVTCEPKSSCDPVQWFGVLVPQNLRSAQESFKHALDLTVKIATLQTQLEAQRVEFCTLKLEQMQVSNK